MKKIIFICVAFLCIPLTALTAEINADSTSYADVKAAYDAASPGDTVIVPAGSSTWTTTLAITKSIYLIGSGIDSTVITNGNISYIISVIPATPADDPIIQISGFTFDGDGSSGKSLLFIQCLDATYDFTHFRIHHNKFQNINTDYCAIYTSGDTYGLIDYNQFARNNITLRQGYDFQIRGNNATSWTKHPVATHGLGTQYFLFIENNSSSTNQHLIDDSGEGARWVYRYNSIDNSNMTNASSVWDIHGDTQNRGNIAVEIYGNTITSAVGSAARSGFRTLDLRGGTVVVYNNTIQATGTSLISIREEFNKYPTSSDAEACGDKITDTYLWNNKNSITSGRIFQDHHTPTDYDTHNCLTEETDYWTDTQDGSDDATTYFTYDVGANRAGTCTTGEVYWETDNSVLYRCIDTNIWFNVYAPYVYPHPSIASYGSGKRTGWSGSGGTHR